MCLPRRQWTPLWMPAIRSASLGAGAQDDRPAVLPAQLGHVIALGTQKETPDRVAVFTRRAGHRGRHT